MRSRGFVGSGALNCVGLRRPSAGTSSPRWLASKSLAPTRFRSNTSCRPSPQPHGGSRRECIRGAGPRAERRISPARPGSALAHGSRAGPHRAYPRERTRAPPHPRCLPSRDPSDEGCAFHRLSPTWGESACAFSISARFRSTDGARRCGDSASPRDRQLPISRRDPRSMSEDPAAAAPHATST